MLYPVEKRFITYSLDMWDTDTQVFWGRVLQG